MFRKSASDRLSSPDQLDQLLCVVKRRSWLPIACLAVLLGLAVVWGFLGRIPVTVEGKAVLVYPKQLKALQTSTSGTVVLLKRVGEVVAADEPIARLRLPELEKQIELEQARLASLTGKHAALSESGKQNAREERELLESQCGLLEKRINSDLARADRILKNNEEFTRKQKKGLQEAWDLTVKMGTSLESHLEAQKTLLAKGLAAEEAVVEARHDVIQNDLRLADLKVKIDEVTLRELRANESYALRVDAIEDLKDRLRELRFKQAQITRKLREADVINLSEEKEIEIRIQRLMKIKSDRETIRSPYQGRILELTVADGSVVAAGQRIGTIEAMVESEALEVVAYFQVKDGKRITSDMAARIAPSTVLRARHGAITGAVIESSRFPVTLDAAAYEVGNSEVAASLAPGGGHIQVRARLDADDATATGYKWTSGGGPDDVKITAGTTASIRVTVARHRPITLVLPIFGEWFGNE